ncbi:MAG: YqjK-like family protein [Propionivibrio sp.]
MNRRLDDLLLRRGRLIERIAGQREALRHDFVPVSAALGKADSAVASVRSFVSTIRHHPVVTSVLAAAVLIFKGKAVLRWARRGFSLWQTWRAVRGTLHELGGRVHL